MKTKKNRDDLLRHLNVIDDALFHKVAEDKRAVEDILRVVLEDHGLVVKQVQPQRFLRNCGNRSVILDALCELSSGAHVNVEVQKADKGNHFKRVRYNLSNVDTLLAERGIQFADLPDVIAVYLAGFDLFHQGLPLYHVRRRVDETGAEVPDGTQCIYVNGTCNDGSPVSQLMGYIMHSEGTNPMFPRLCDKVSYFKDTGEGKRKMDTVFDEYCEMWKQEGKDEARAEALEEARAEARNEMLRKHTETIREMVRAMFANGCNEELVAKVAPSLTPEELRELKEQALAPVK